jgi:hypothetical protein
MAGRFRHLSDRALADLVLLARLNERISCHSHGRQPSIRGPPVLNLPDPSTWSVSRSLRPYASRHEIVSTELRTYDILHHLYGVRASTASRHSRYGTRR